MNGTSRSLSVIGTTVIAIGIFAAFAPDASAYDTHDVYPPGWNHPTPNMPKPMFDFRMSWGWNDYQRYWPDQTSPGPAKSRPAASAPVIYGMVPGGSHYHQLQ